MGCAVFQLVRLISQPKDCEEGAEVKRCEHRNKAGNGGKKAGKDSGRKSEEKVRVTAQSTTKIFS